MRVRHPYALDDDAPEPDGTVHYGGRRRWADVDDDGTFVVPDDEPHNLDEWAERYGYDLSDLVVDANGSAEQSESETCEEIVERTGEVCGRDLPCPYHSEG